MSWLPPNPWLSLAAFQDDQGNGQADQRVERMIIELEQLHSAVQNQVQDLNQPLTVILGLSELLLARVDADSPLAADLNGLVRQVGRLSQTIKTVNGLIDQKHRVWRQLDYAHQGSPNHELARSTTTTKRGME